ncbi:hypothetical protein V8G54_028598 [Vigna mungo]|uniref:Retrotransposon Copia-like N-terminal domain-containing protein n=1 Tax=Vigna mungo TaxID=3915 RepID=A0AAQ3RKN4_VIGMU
MAISEANTQTHDSPHSYLYLHPNENPAISLVSPVLNNTNYHSWNRSFVTALSAKNKVEFVLGSAPQPAQTDATFHAWFRCNSMVVSWLLHSVSPSIRESIIWMDNAVDIWNDLKIRFAQGDLARISTLQMEATTLSQGELSVTEFFTKLRIIWDELDSFRPDPDDHCSEENQPNGRIPNDNITKIKQIRDDMTMYARRSLHPGGPGWDTLNRPPPEVSPVEPPRYRNTLRLKDLLSFPRMSYPSLPEKA